MTRTAATTAAGLLVVLTLLTACSSAQPGTAIPAATVAGPASIPAAPGFGVLGIAVSAIGANTVSVAVDFPASVAVLGRSAVLRLSQS